MIEAILSLFGLLLILIISLPLFVLLAIFIIILSVLIIGILYWGFCTLVFAGVTIIKFIANCINIISDRYKKYD